MGMFSNLMGKIFAHANPAAQPSTPAAVAPVSAPAAAATTVPSAPMPAAPAEPIPQMVEPAEASLPAAPQSVDVAAILGGLQQKSGEDLDWKKSIVDMLKLLGMDSSLGARKELAADLGYSGDEHDSASMNEWLHKTVLQKLADNGGKVPAELLG